MKKVSCIVFFILLAVVIGLMVIGIIAENAMTPEERAIRNAARTATAEVKAVQETAQAKQDEAEQAIRNAASTATAGVEVAQETAEAKRDEEERAARSAARTATAESEAAQATAEAKQEAVREATSKRLTATAEAEFRRKGFHCLSLWDGHHDGLEKLVQKNLNDPDSLRTIETRITPENAQGKHTVLMDFTATNAFGARVRHTARATIDTNTCVATLLAIN